MPTFATSCAPILGAPLVAIAFLWLAAAIGRKMMRWFGVSRIDSAAEGGVVAVALGTGVLQLVPFALGVAHLLGANSLRIALAVLALALVPELWAIAKRARLELAGWARALNTGWIIALTPALLIAALLTLAPTVDADGLSYHLPVPKRWIASGTLAYLPTYPYSNTPMGGEMLFMIGLVLAGDSAAKALHFSLGIMAAIGVYATGARLTRVNGNAVGAVSTMLYLVGPAGVVSLLGTAYLEGLIAFAMIATVLAWLIWLREGNDGWLRCAFVLVGVTIAFKLTALVFALSIVAFTIVAFWDRAQGRLQPTLLPVARQWPLVLLAALPVLPWFCRSAVLTGNPVFPLFVGLIPSRDLSPALAAQFEHFNRYLIWATRFGMGWSLMTRKLILLAVGIAVTAAMGVIQLRLRTRFARVTAVVIWGAILVQISAVGLYLRYWIPVFAVLTPPVVACFAGLLVGRWQTKAFVALTAVASLVQVRSTLNMVGNDLKGTTLAALGLESPQTYLERHLPLYPLYRYANRELSPSSRILLGYYCGAFHLDRETYCAEFVQDSLRFTTWEEFTADAFRLGVTHVLAPTALVDGGPQPATTDSAGPSRIIRVKENEFFARLLKQHGTLLLAASDQGLYAVDLRATQNP